MVSARVKEYMSYNKETKENTDSLYIFNNDGDISTASTNRQNKGMHTNKHLIPQLESENDNTSIMRFSEADM